jgi:hypothetical protein
MQADRPSTVASSPSARRLHPLQIHKKHENKTPLEGATMYALIVFTLGWPAPEPVGTFSRIEVCQATKVNMSQALADISMRCEKVSPLILTKSGVSAK